MIEPLANKAFTKGLISAILSEIPAASIASIVLGAGAQSAAAEAEQIAARYGISAGGKCKAGKILGTIGKIVGIVSTIFWALYFIIYFFYFLALMGMM